jgi:hypothetical protein
MERKFPGALTVLWPSLDAVCSLGLLFLADLGPLTLDVTKMYRDNIAPDPGSLLRGYGESSAGAGVFYVLAGTLRAVLARKGR